MVMLMVMAAAAFFIVVMVMVMLMVMAAAAMLLLVVVMVFMLQLSQLGSQRSLTCHGRQDLRSFQFTPTGRDDGSVRIMLPEEGHGGIQLGLGDHIGTGHDNSGGRFNLIVIELAKVLHIDLDLTGIHNRHCIAQFHIGTGNLLNRSHHIGQLAHTGGLNDDPVRGIFRNHLLQSLAEIAHQTAADAAGVHLGNVNAGILQETAIDTDLAEFILDQHQLLACVGLLDHFLDQRGLTGTQKTGININFCHIGSPILSLVNLI